MGFVMMFMGPDLSIKFPYYIEKEHGTKELESWYLHEPDDSE
jgi:hypothetical protein